MLKIVMNTEEFWDDELQEFYTVPGRTVYLEHSLFSISKWESKWHKSYTENCKELSHDETLDYIRCMIVGDEEFDDYSIALLYLRHGKEINDYINDPMTATTVSNNGQKSAQRKMVTSELVYYWMFSQQIPMECEHWHFNRLMTLIRVFNAESGPQKKMSKQEIFEQNRALNAARKAKAKAGHK